LIRSTNELDFPQESEREELSVPLWMVLLENISILGNVSATKRAISFRLFSDSAWFSAIAF